MGGKSGTTTSSVAIPPEVLARYNAVNARAESVASTPFQPYTGQFVAGLTPTQQAGISATSQYSQAAQPYYQAATGQLLSGQQAGQQGIQQAYSSLGAGANVGQQYAQAATQGLGGALQYAAPYQAGATQAAMMGAQGIQPGQLQTAQYMNPYTQAVADTTYQALRQQQQQEMQGATANAIRSGAFGGDRAGLVAANLARQQQLGTAQAMAPIYQQGYGQALQTAQQQQGVQLSADQANRAALQNLAQQLQGIGQQGYGQQMGAAQQLAALGQQQFGQGLGAAQQYGALGQAQYGMGTGTAQQLAALGSGAQQSALQGAQAQLGAGTLEQQTQQADLTARYQQFLQERGYPFQVAQFLANIAMGTGALSGQTTTTTQPMPFFSDRRVKHDVKEIGKTHDGQPIYSFKYNGSDQTQIGLMAQDVEKKHPDAVYDMGGVKGVDYKQATEKAEREERYEGGLVPASMGGAVNQPGAYERGGYYDGGSVDPNDIQALIAMQREALGPFAESGLYGGSHHEAPFSSAKGVVPAGRLHTPRMMKAAQTPSLPESGAQQLLGAYDKFKDTRGRIQEARDMIKQFSKTPQTEMDASRSAPTSEQTAKMAGPDIVPAKGEQSWLDWAGEKTGLWADGGLVPRRHYVQGGTAFSDPYKPYRIGEGQVPEEVLELEKPAELSKSDKSSGAGSRSGLSIGDAMSIGKFILPFFLKDGGVVPRQAYEEGGSPDLDRYLNAIAKIESSGNYGALGPKTNSGDRAYGKYQVMGANVPTWTEEAVGRRMTPEEFLADKAAQDATARHHFGKALNQYGTPEDAASVWFSGRPMQKAGNAADITGTTVPEYINRFRSALGEADMPARGASTASGVVPSKSESQGLFPAAQNFLAENQGWLSPLGAGLMGMVQSRSPFLAGALLEGAGAGLKEIAPSQQAIAQQKLTGATTGLTEAETAAKSFHFVPGIGGFMWVVDRQTGDKKLIPYSVYSENFGQYELAYGPRPTSVEAQQAAKQVGGEQPTAGTPTAPAATPEGTPAAPETKPETKPETDLGARPSNFDDQSVKAAQESVKAIQKAQSTMMPGVATQPIEEGTAYRKGVTGIAQATRNNFGNTVDYIKNISNAVELSGFNETGTQAQLRGDVAKAFGTLARAFGVPTEINLGDINDINRKMAALRGAALASGVSESLGALELMSDALVKGDMSEDTMAKLGAMTLMLEGRAMDRLDHSDKWGKVTGSNYYLAGKDFERVNPTTNFEKEVGAVKWAIQNLPEVKEMFSAPPEQVDQYFMETFGLPNMSRYFRAR